MFDIGFWELSLIAVIALLILGPERLPRVARMAGMWVGKMKKMVADVKSNINEELRMEELNALKQAGQDLKEGLTSTQRGLNEAGSEFKKSVELDAATEEKVDVATEEKVDVATEEKVDVAAAINQSVPQPDGQPVAKRDSDAGSVAVKLKTTKKRANIIAKSAVGKAPASKKSARKKSTSTKSAASGRKKKKANKRAQNQNAENQTSQ